MRIPGDQNSLYLELNTALAARQAKRNAGATVKQLSAEALRSIADGDDLAVSMGAERESSEGQPKQQGRQQQPQKDDGEQDDSESRLSDWV